MDQQIIDLIRKHRLSASFGFAALLGVMLYNFTGLGARLSAIIAICVGVSDYVAMSFLLSRMEGQDNE